MFACPVCAAVELNERPYERWPPPPEVDLSALAPPYQDALGAPSYEVCASCGFEFGFDDDPGTARPVTFAEYRAEWMAAGRPRFSPPPSR